MEIEEPTEEEKDALRTTFQSLVEKPQPRRVAAQDAFVFEEESKEKEEIERMRESLQRMKIVSRAKVTQDRVYSSAYHPEKTKDLIFFGGRLFILRYSSTCVCSHSLRQARSARYLGC